MTLTVVNKPNRSIPQNDWWAHHEARKAAQEYTAREPNPFDRAGRSAIGYALAVLRLDGRRLVQRDELFYLDGNPIPAPPLMLLQEANRTLKRLGWPQIADSSAWVI